MIKFVAFLGAIGSVAAVSLNTDAGMQMDSFDEAYPEYNFAELDVVKIDVDCDADFSKLIAKVEPLKKKGDEAATNEWKALKERKGDCDEIKDAEKAKTTGKTDDKPVVKPAFVINAEKNAKETCDDCDKAKAAVVAAEIKAKENEAARVAAAEIKAKENEAARVAAEAKKESDRVEKIKKEKEAEKLR